MRTVEVPNVGFRVPVLGFGCTGLMGPRTDRERCRFLETAFDAGVRHFDVARYYGFGEAERIVGRFARGRRAEITITTKFGIKPPARVGPMRVLAKAARTLVRLAPFTRRAISAQAGKLVQSGVFTPDEAQRSLETSLRELATDYVDFFLVHGFRAELPASEELVAFLERSVAAGKIRNFGVGTDIESAAALARRRHPLARVVQFENNVMQRNLERFPSDASSFVFTFQPLSHAFSELRGRLTASPELARSWSKELGADLAEPQTLADLMLCFAAAANGSGITLFQSRNLERIRADVEAVHRERFTASELAVFGRLVATELQPPSAGMPSVRA